MCQAQVCRHVAWCHAPIIRIYCCSAHGVLNKVCVLCVGLTERWCWWTSPCGSCLWYTHSLQAHKHQHDSGSSSRLWIRGNHHGFQSTQERNPRSSKDPKTWECNEILPRLVQTQHEGGQEVQQFWFFIIKQHSYDFQYQPRVVTKVMHSSALGTTSWTVIDDRLEKFSAALHFV